MATLDKDSKARLEKFVNHYKEGGFDEDFDAEDLFLDLCRVLILMLVAFAIFYGVWIS